MRKKGIIFGFLLMMTFGIILSSCVKEDRTIALIGDEYYIIESEYFLEDILSVIPDSVRPRFYHRFGSIPKGYVPPRLDFDTLDSTKKEASYVVTPRHLDTSNVPGLFLDVNLYNNAYMRFYEQHNGLVKIDFSDGEKTVIDTAFVCGNGSNFTVYFIENMAYDIGLDHQIYNVKMKRGVIMTGRVTNAGLANFRYSTIVLETKDNFNGATESIPIGSFYIYKDNDSISERCVWPLS